MKILRLPQTLDKLGIKRSTFYDRFLRTGVLRPVRIGPKAIGFIEAELDALIKKLAAERETQPRGRGRPKKCDSARPERLK